MINCLKPTKFETSIIVLSVLVICFTGCVAQIPDRPLPASTRVLWVKDFKSVGTVEIDYLQKKNLSDKIALLVDSIYNLKFSEIYRRQPPIPEKSIIVTGVIHDFGPNSTSDGDPGVLSTWMQQFGAGKLSVEFTVTDTVNGGKLIDKALINYPVYQGIDFFGWTKIEQTVNVTVEKIAGMIGQLKIPE